MSQETQPRVWLITGANSGIGLALALAVLKHGEKVIATARDLSKIPESLSEAKHVRLNLNDSDETIRQVGLEALKCYGRIDVLVHNAGAGLPGTVEFVSDAQLKENFQTNVFGPLSLTRALLPSFREQKSGTVVTISSQGGMVSWPGFSTYCSTKVSFDFFMEALGAELAPYGIDSLLIQPGFIYTDWWVKARNAGKGTKGVTNGRTGPSDEQLQVEENSGNPEGPYPHIPDLDATMTWAIGTGNCSDMDKAVERIWEFVTGNGEVGGMRMKFKEQAKEKNEGLGMVRLPLGMDCYGIYSSRVESLAANLKAYESITKSVNLTQEQLEELKKAKDA
ncbi:NAD(P)-binding protein [Dendrothele bispora CBS 962.96]|uniref:NAD(P)-binding protein n=1 Tax=Dendrothele bispora (strain CBS 962.96) TaxID=1314807 RepID=A0A4S8MTL3_DENBC|nr:NAD(P)-binding protein [Dendrothele bispora CBS 962.96]